MGSTLEHGIYLPSEGEKNCYQGLAGNWNKVDGALGDVAELKQSIESKFTKEIVTELPTEDINPYCIYMILKTDPETDNVYDEWVYINNNWEYLGNTKVDMTQYYTKQEVNQLPAVASGVTATKVGNYDAHIANGDIHVTASDKAKWDTVALIKQLRLVNTQVGSATTIAFANIDDTNGIKVGDKCMDLDAKMFEITAVDTTNETVTVDSALIDLALDANVMHLSGNETASGQKTFSDMATLNSYLYFTNSSVTKGTVPQTTVAPYRIYFGSGVNYGASLFNIDTSVSNTGVQSFIFRSAENVVSGDDARFALIYDPNRTQPRYLSVKGGIEPNANNTYDCGSGTNTWKDLYCYHGYFRGQQQHDEYSGNARTNLTLLANRDTSGQSCCVVDTFRENTAQGTGSHIIGFGIKENSIRYEGCRFSWLWDNNLNGYSFSIRPTLQGANQAVEHCIGLSTDKWDKINGINPGALSLPDLSNGIDISGYITTGSSTNDTYTAPADGYLAIIMASSSTCGMYVYDYSKGFFMRSNSITDSTYSNVCGIFIPILKNQTMNIASRVTESIVSAKFYPCLGNV